MEKTVAFDLLSVGVPRHWLLKAHGILRAIYKAHGRGHRDIDFLYEAGLALLPPTEDERVLFEGVEKLRQHAVEWAKNPELQEEQRRALHARKNHRKHVLLRVAHAERDQAIAAIAVEFGIRPHAAGNIYTIAEKRRRKAALNAACALVAANPEWKQVGRLQISNILYGLTKPATEADFEEARKRFVHYPPEQTRWRERLRGAYAAPVATKPWRVGLLPRAEHAELIALARAGQQAARNELIARDLDDYSVGERRKFSDAQGRIRAFGLAGPYDDITRHDLFETYRALSGRGVYANWVEIARLLRGEATVDYEQRRIVLGRPRSALVSNYLPEQALAEREKLIATFPPRLVAELERTKKGEGFCPRCPPVMRRYARGGGALLVSDERGIRSLCLYHTLMRFATIKRRREHAKDEAVAREMIA